MVCCADGGSNLSAAVARSLSPAEREMILDSDPDERRGVLLRMSDAP